MQQKLFEILGLHESATDIEVDNRYNELRTRYRNDMFLEGEEGQNAADKLTELERVYSDILDHRMHKDTAGQAQNADENNVTSALPPVYQVIHEMIKSGDINGAQTQLDNIMEREGEWNYYQAMVYYNKDWFTDSKKHLEKALAFEPNNDRFKETLARLESKMYGGTQNSQNAQQVNTNGQSQKDWWEGKGNQNPNGNPNGQSGRTNQNPNGWDDNDRQMGGCDQSASCCMDLLCMNMLCNCCGGGC